MFAAWARESTFKQPCVAVLGSRDRWILGTQWPANVGGKRFTERPCLKIGGRETAEGNLPTSPCHWVGGVGGGGGDGGGGKLYK